MEVIIDWSSSCGFYSDTGKRMQQVVSEPSILGGERRLESQQLTAQLKEIENSLRKLQREQKAHWQKFKAELKAEFGEWKKIYQDLCLANEELSMETEEAGAGGQESEEMELSMPLPLNLKSTKVNDINCEPYSLNFSHNTLSKPSEIVNNGLVEQVSGVVDEESVMLGNDAIEISEECGNYRKFSLQFSLDAKSGGGKIDHGGRKLQLDEFKETEFLPAVRQNVSVKELFMILPISACYSSSLSWLLNWFPRPMVKLKFVAQNDEEMEGKDNVLWALAKAGEDQSYVFVLGELSLLFDGDNAASGSGKGSDEERGLLEEMGQGERSSRKRGVGKRGIVIAHEGDAEEKGVAYVSVAGEHGWMASNWFTMPKVKMKFRSQHGKAIGEDPLLAPISNLECSISRSTMEVGRSTAVKSEVCLTIEGLNVVELVSECDDEDDIDCVDFSSKLSHNCDTASLRLLWRCASTLEAGSSLEASVFSGGYILEVFDIGSSRLGMDHISGLVEQSSKIVEEESTMSMKNVLAFSGKEFGNLLRLSNKFSLQFDVDAKTKGPAKEEGHEAYGATSGARWAEQILLNLAFNNNTYYSLTWLLVRFPKPMVKMKFIAQHDEELYAICLLDNILELLYLSANIVELKALVNRLQKLYYHEVGKFIQFLVSKRCQISEKVSRNKNMIRANIPNHNLVPGEICPMEKDEKSALKVGLRKKKIFTDYVSTHRAKKGCRKLGEMRHKKLGSMIPCGQGILWGRDCCKYFPAN